MRACLQTNARTRDGVMKALLFCLLFSFAAVSYGEPPNWPWRGVLIQSCCDDTGPDDVEALARNGASAIVLNIKVPMRSKFSRLDTQDAWDTSIAWVVEMLDACKSHGVTGIVRLNQLPLDATKGLHEWSPEFWSDRSHLDDVIVALRKLGEALSPRGDEFGAYIVLSEPITSTLGVKHTPKEWPEFQLEIVDELRKIDPDRYIVVTPGPGGSPARYGEFAPLKRHNIIYGAHVYAPHEFTHQGINNWKDKRSRYPGLVGRKRWNKATLEEFVGPLLRFQEQYKVPVFIGEFSVIHGAEGDTEYLKDLMGIFDEAGWGWSYFLYRGNPIWNIGDPAEVPNTNNRGEKRYLDAQVTRWRLITDQLKQGKASRGPSP